MRIDYVADPVITTADGPQAVGQADQAVEQGDQADDTTADADYGLQYTTMSTDIREAVTARLSTGMIFT